MQSYMETVIEETVIVAHAWNASTREAEGGGLLKEDSLPVYMLLLPGQAELLCEILSEVAKENKQKHCRIAR